MRITSAPASTARTAASWRLCRRAMAAMSMASVKMSPLKPISPRSNVVRTFSLSVAGVPLSSVIDGTAIWAVMMPPTPSSIARLNGTNSMESRRRRSTVMSGRSMWESTSVSPCPGKCFPVAMPPLSWIPRTNMAPMEETAAGSSPNARTLMTGLSGLLLTSSTGANGTWIPTARASLAVTAPT